ncbi:hypothetical protein ACW4TU_20435 [Streptomyces sp. QTS52]
MLQGGQVRDRRGHPGWRIAHRRRSRSDRGFNGGTEGAEQLETALREATKPANPVRIEDVRVDDHDAVFVRGI